MAAFLQVLKNKYLYYIISFIVLVLFCFYAENKIFSDGYNKGLTDKQQELDLKYNKLMSEKLEEQKKLLNKNYEILLDNQKNNKEVEIVYKDKIKVVKEIIKEDNFKCEMTNAQIENLNKLIKE